MYRFLSTDGRTDGWTHGRMYRRIGPGGVTERKGGCVDSLMDGRTYGQTDGQTDRDRQTDGQTNGRADGQTRHDREGYVTVRE